MLGIVFNVITVLFIAYGMGKLIESFFDAEISFVPVGFFCYLGIMQFINYGIVTIGLNSKVFLLLYLGMGIVPYFIGIIRKIDFKPTKMDLISLLFALVFVGIGTFKSMNTGLGINHLDTSFYLSLVNEKSVMSKLGGPESIFYYSGTTQPIDFTYDYQSFYILEAMLIKLLRNFKFVGAIGTVNYLWSGSITYFVMMGMFLGSFFQVLFKDKKLLGVVWLLLGAYIFYFKYYSLILAFYGNTWRVLVISYMSYFIHRFLKSDDIKDSIIVGLLGSGLIAFSSSGGFMMAFVGATLMIYSLFVKQDMKHYVVSMIPLLIAFPYLVIVLWSMSKLLAIVAGVAVIVYAAVVYVLYKKNVSFKYFFKLHQVAVVVIVVLLWVYSYFIQLNGEYPYSYFFDNHSAYDMVHDYLGKYNLGLIRINRIFWTIVIIYLLLDRDVYKKYLLVLVVVFINPLVTPFIIQYLTKFVFYRDFELVINLYSLGLFVSSLSLLKWDKVVMVVSLGLIVLIGYYTVEMYQSYFTPELVPTEGFNPLYRINEDDMDIYEALQKECTYDRVTVISQAEGTKGFVTHIQMPYSVYETRSIDLYEEELPHESMFDKDIAGLINALYHREYTGQQVFQELPDYDSLNDEIIRHGAQYIILYKDHYKLKDEEYVPVYFDVRGIADVIYENNTYVLMKVR